MTVVDLLSARKVKASWGGLPCAHSLPVEASQAPSAGQGLLHNSMRIGIVVACKSSGTHVFASGQPPARGAILACVVVVCTHTLSEAVKARRGRQAAECLWKGSTRSCRDDGRRGAKGAE